MRSIQLFNQWDPQWANVPLGQSGLTMGRYGCYTDFICMGLVSIFMKHDPFGNELDPGRLAQMLSDIDGYDAGGQVIWGKVSELYLNVRLYGREFTTNIPNWNNLHHTLTPKKAIMDIQTANKKGQVVGICVDRVKNDNIKPDHIVLALETPEKLEDWTIADPDGGLRMKFSERYGSPLTGVCGYRTLIGSPANFPTYATETDKQAGQAIGLAADSRYSKDDIIDVLMSA